MSKKTDKTEFEEQHTGAGAKPSAATGAPTPAETSPHSPYATGLSEGDVQARIDDLQSQIDGLRGQLAGASKQHYPKMLYKGAKTAAEAIASAVTVLDAPTEEEARADGHVFENPGEACGETVHTPNATDFGGDKGAKLDEIPATSAVDQVARTGEPPAVAGSEANISRDSVYEKDGE